MSSSYTILASIIGSLLLFLYISWMYVSARYVWSKDKNKNNDNFNNRKNSARWRKVIDSKNENLGWFDLGNHIIIIGIILFAIFILKNA